MEQTVDLFLMATGQRLLEQSAKAAQVRIDLQQLAPGLLILPAFNSETEANTPDKFILNPARLLDSMMNTNSSDVT